MCFIDIHSWIRSHLSIQHNQAWVKVQHHQNEKNKNQGWGGLIIIVLIVVAILSVFR